MCDVACAKDVVSVLTPLGALIIAGFGLSTWHKQLTGSNEYNLAKRVVLATYLVQEEIKVVRFPLVTYSIDDFEGRDKIDIYREIYGNRLEKLGEKWAELQALRLEAKVIYGQDEYDKFNGLFDNIGKLRGSLHIFLTARYHAFNKLNHTIPQETIDSSEDIVYWTSDDDSFSLEVVDSVATIVDFFKGKLKK